MSDIFIHNLDESSKLKSGDYGLFDVVDPNTGEVYTKKVDYRSLIQTISSGVVNTVVKRVQIIQNNVDVSIVDVSSKYDIRGTDYSPDNKIIGPLIAAIPLTATSSNFYGNVNVNSSTINNVAPPALGGDASNKKYVDSSCEITANAIIALTGGVMTSGNITLAADQTQPSHANKKIYVDNNFIAKPQDASNGKVLTYINKNWSPVTQNYIINPSPKYNNYVLSWNGSSWVASSLSGINNGTFLLSGSYIPTPTNPNNGQYLTYNSGTWSPTWLPPYPNSSNYIPKTDGVDGQVLTYNNGNWAAGDNDELPVGMIAAFPNFNIPHGWFICDGSSKDANLFPELFGILGYSFGGNGSNFSIPDYREMFLRGHGGNRGVDSDTNRAPGSTQESQLTRHWHGHAIGVQNDNTWFIVRNWGLLINWQPQSHAICGHCNGQSPNSHPFLGSGTIGTTDNINDGNSDNKPANMTVVYCIKAYNGGGNIDFNANGLQIPDFIGSNVRYGEYGYQRLPSGLFIQWGSNWSPDENSAFSYPVAFPNAALQVFATNRDRQGGRVDNAWGHPIDRFTYRIACKRSDRNDQSGFATSWFAVGY